MTRTLALAASAALLVTCAAPSRAATTAATKPSPAAKPAPAPATPTAPASPAAGGPCSAPECRQFDFWLGDWTVEDASGNPLGTNRVEKILDGCVVQEHWSGAKGDRGTSLSAWTASDSLWHQTWVDNQGTVLELRGKLVTGEMWLEGVGRASGRVNVINRISWRPVDANRVEQHWEVSTDGRKSWLEVFWGLYVRKSGAAK